MGNCQAIDAATLVIQHPSGKVDKLFWPIAASEVMKMNPGHYVALLISTTLCPPPPPPPPHPLHAPNSGKNTNNITKNNSPIRLTKIKLLKPNDTLVLGHVYRLITTQEVMKGLKAKKQAKVRNTGQVELEGQEWVKEKRNHDNPREEEARRRMSQLDKENQVINRNERIRARTTTTTTTSNNSATARSRTWHPSLNSISEAAS